MYTFVHVNKDRIYLSSRTRRHSYKEFLYKIYIYVCVCVCAYVYVYVHVHVHVHVHGHVYVYAYVCVYIYVYIYIYIYNEYLFSEYQDEQLPLQPNRSQPQTLKQQAYANKQRHPSLTIKVSRQVEWFNTSFSSSIRLHRHASPRWAAEGSPTHARTHWSLLCRVVQTWDL